MLAQVIGGLASSVALGPEGAVAILESLGWKATPAQNPFVFYGSTVSVTCCAGLFLAAVLAGLGALGGLLWYQTSGKKSAAAAM